MATKAVKPSAFVWEGKDKKGRKTKGEIQGASIAMVKAELRKQGINPTKVKKKAISFAGKGRKVKPMDIAVFTRQLATMMKAGVPLIQSFEITADGCENPTMRDLVNDVKNDVAGGSSLAEALSKRPKYFDDLYCSLVASGEQSGALESLLDRIATYKEKTESLKAKIKKAMTYPIAVVVVAIIVTAILLIKVVPQFQEVFAGFGADLPAFTMFVIQISEFLQAYWLYFLAGIGVLIFASSKALEKSKGLRDGRDRFVLKIPIIGDIIDKSAVARYARTLSTTFAAGVPLVDALDSVAGAAGNVVYYQAARQIKEDISSGQQLQFAMKNTAVFPSMAVQMVGIGEESGALDEMLDKVANHYEEEVDNMVDNLTSLMEPIIMSVLGVLVGGLIVAMYLPIFQLGSVV
ncbi:type II secretion system F family protein [Endozoicomonas sp. SM1973]|uniref:Type II secretion system F family protein n=1 Tax=Spartinivicinus marinus TaxID=2994442 RepID=A0A853I6A9_9GAMM|nr:type II secretion system F family protein [Spartinivicinus marinus]MCX4028329.1 type II secretion system F family protein [Spartinivicinus marinus]NYZ65664.1 type II secretion system F family protein [Spartinivicinus marinus]